MSSETGAEAQPPSLLAGVITVLVVVVGIVGWIVLGSSMHLTSFYASFLFLWYWATVDKLDFSKFLPSMIGAMLGIGLAWSLHALPTMLGATNGTILALCLVLGSLFLVIIERVHFAFNPALTLYLTVVAAPALMETTDFRELALATLLGGGFFGLFVFIVLFIVSKISPQPAAET